MRQGSLLLTTWLLIALPGTVGAQESQPLPAAREWQVNTSQRAKTGLQRRYEDPIRVRAWAVGGRPLRVAPACVRFHPMHSSRSRLLAGAFFALGVTLLLAGQEPRAGEPKK